MFAFRALSSVSQPMNKCSQSHDATQGSPGQASLSSAKYDHQNTREAMDTLGLERLQGELTQIRAADFRFRLDDALLQIAETRTSPA